MIFATNRTTISDIPEMHCPVLDKFIDIHKVLVAKVTFELLRHVLLRMLVDLCRSLKRESAVLTLVRAIISVRPSEMAV